MPNLKSVPSSYHKVGVRARVGIRGRVTVRLTHPQAHTISIHTHTHTHTQTSARLGWRSTTQRVSRVRIRVRVSLVVLLQTLFQSQFNLTCSADERRRCRGPKYGSRNPDDDAQCPSPPKPRSCCDQPSNEATDDVIYTRRRH